MYSCLRVVVFGLIQHRQTLLYQMYIRTRALKQPCRRDSVFMFINRIRQSERRIRLRDYVALFLHCILYCGFIRRLFNAKMCLMMALYGRLECACAELTSRRCLPKSICKCMRIEDMGSFPSRVYVGVTVWYFWNN